MLMHHFDLRFYISVAKAAIVVAEQVPFTLVSLKNRDSVCALSNYATNKIRYSFLL